MFDAVASPDPGIALLSLALSKPVRNTSFLLVEATSREVFCTASNSDRVNVNTAALSQGLFSYRLVDRNGVSLTHGNWLKQ